MKASVSDLRNRTRDILNAIERGEKVTLSYRGKEKAVIVPLKGKPSEASSKHTAYGMWRDRQDLGTWPTTWGDSAKAASVIFDTAF